VPLRRFRKGSRRVRNQQALRGSSSWRCSVRGTRQQGAGGSLATVAPTRHLFLTAAWIRAARSLRDEIHAELGGELVAPPLRVNLVVVDLPFDDHGDELHAHVDTTAGIDVDTGHLDDARLTLRADYATVRALLIEQDQVAVMRAFMESRLSVDGDLSILLGLQAQAGDLDDATKERARSVAGRLRAITAD
jgi:hypothetical protein